MFPRYSTSLSGGNLVDSLPPARHTEAVRGPHGGFGLATIGTLDHHELTNERKYEFTLPELSVGVFYCMCRLLLSLISKKIVSETMIIIPFQIFIRGPTNADFPENCGIA